MDSNWVKLLNELHGMYYAFVRLLSKENADVA